MMVSRDGLNFYRWLEPIVPSAPNDRGEPKQLHGVGLVELRGGPIICRCTQRRLLRRAGQPVASIRIPQGRFRIG